MSFKPSKTDIDDTPVSTKTYKMCFADYDTPIFQAANGIQTEFIRVKHKKSGNIKIFNNVTEFRGRVNKKTGAFGGWLKDLNDKNEAENKKVFKLEDFNVEHFAEINDPEDSSKTIIEEAVAYFDYSVGMLKKYMDSDDYRLIVGIGSNPRDGWANILQYKGERKEKPILFAEIKEVILDKYKNKIILAKNKEGDDEISKLAWENYQGFLKTGVWENCISYIDKDINNCPSPSFNYNKTDEGFTIRDLDDAMGCYCQQLLSGDKSTDNIQGLPNISDDFREKYGLRRASGLGKTGAIKILETCDSTKQKFERVCEAYRTFYGDDLVEVKSWRGEDLKMSWLDILNENARLLWMYRDDTMKYDIRETLDEYGVDYGVACGVGCKERLNK